MARAIDRFGWPGGTVILIFTFVEVHSSSEQKREIIEMLIHPDSPGGRAIGLLVLLTSGIFIAQHNYWKRKMKTMQHEIDRLAEWKSQYQQELLPVELHHTQEFAVNVSEMESVGKG